MPRLKTQTLQKTQKKGKNLKDKIVQQTQELVKTYASIFVIDSNLNTKYKTDLMEDLKALTATEEHKAKLFFARRTLVSHELKEMSKDYPELDKLIPYLTGKRGLLFTTLKKSEAIEKLLAEKYSGLEQDPQAGDMAPKKVLIPAGIKDLPFSLEETLTRLGLPIKVEKEQIKFEKDFEVCTLGETLDSKKCKILKQMKIPVKAGCAKLVCWWTDGKIQQKF